MVRRSVSRCADFGSGDGGNDHGHVHHITYRNIIMNNTHIGFFIKTGTNRNNWCVPCGLAVACRVPMRAAVYKCMADGRQIPPYPAQSPRHLLQNALEPCSPAHPKPCHAHPRILSPVMLSPASEALSCSPPHPKPCHAHPRIRSPVMLTPASEALSCSPLHPKPCFRCRHRLATPPRHVCAQGGARVRGALYEHHDAQRGFWLRG